MLVHWGRDKMAAIFLTTFSNAFLDENVWISIHISLKFVHEGPINNIPAFVQKMAWHRPSEKPLSEQWWSVYWPIYASLGLNEFMTAPSDKIAALGHPLPDIRCPGAGKVYRVVYNISWISVSMFRFPVGWLVNFPWRDLLGKRKKNSFVNR